MQHIGLAKLTSINFNHTVVNDHGHFIGRRFVSVEVFVEPVLAALKWLSMHNVHEAKEKVLCLQ